MPASSLIDSLRAQIPHSRARAPKIGYVTAYDPANYAVRVRLEPESSANEHLGEPDPVVETNWIPMHRGFGGSGWGMVAPPKADPNPPYGDLALVFWPDGGHGMALVGFATDKERQYNPGTQVQNGEMVWINPNGTVVKFLNDGTVELTSANGGTVKISSSGAITVKGAGGAGLEISNSSPASVGSLSGNDGDLVTRKDLQTVIDNLRFAIGISCQTGNSAVVPGVSALASTTIKGTD